MTYTARYSINDTVWFMHDNKPTVGRVSVVAIRQGASAISQSTSLVPGSIKVEYNVYDSEQHERIEEAELFPTKEELIESL